MTPEQRLQAIFAKSIQHDGEQSYRSKLDNKLVAKSHELKELAHKIEEKVTNLIFIEMDKFLESQGWISEIQDAKNKRYTQAFKNIYISAIKPASGKFEFIIKHDLFESINHRIEVSFKDSTTISHFKTATQSLNIKKDMSIEVLEDWVKGLQSTHQKLKTESEKLKLEDLTFEVIKVGQSHRKKLPNFIEAFLSILENQ
ncbi:hypothetical protein [Acinetobacter sp. ANC 5414]|uniref:hypothetical protein n=1 Tax=Acinetobacter sp. ANC 5414 TaxID=2731251 RepID=UPI00148F4DF7|nr:hypothetical protein [Acinetobacter sp. ANC 5414]NNG99763.1 hypothetical protein [Acinetobacter sp. ANC 5414]